MDNDKIKILIVGSGAKALVLANKICQYNYVEKVYITGETYGRFDTPDIRESDLTGLLMFVLKNEIDLTIAVSEKALENDIVSFFQSNGQNIFGPTKDSCNFMLNKILCKKILYKIQAPIPKFGMFNKISQISDYLKNSNFPVIIQTAQNSNLDDEKMVCPTLKSALNFINNIFLKGECDLLIEDYVFGHNFTVYFITDGYSAIPMNTTGIYKFINENGGMYTDGCACYCPDYKISMKILSDIKNTVLEILNYLDNNGKTYVGIIGVEGVLINEDNFVISDMKPFLQNHDIRAVLNLCEVDLIKIFTSCINGFFSDEYEEIKTNNLSSVSISIYSDLSNQEIRGLNDFEDVDFIRIKKKNDKYYSDYGQNFILTKNAGTLSRAKKYLSDELKEINFKGMKYSKVILNNIDNYRQ